MIGGRSDLKVVLVSGPIDFRAGINKLASLVANELGRNPYSSDVFVVAHRHILPPCHRHRARHDAC